MSTKSRKTGNLGFFLKKNLMKISILLPYKENFSPNYAGAVSLFVKDISKISKYKKIYIYMAIQSLKKHLH